MPDGDILLVFARAPREGRVKTRLIPHFGARRATEIYRRLLAMALNAALTSTWSRIQVWCTEEVSDGFFDPYRRQARVRFHQQCGDDLGSRMAHACEQALRDADRIALMGTDCPALGARLLGRVRERLSGDHEVVMVPALDGGYVLIGMREACPGLFEGIEWGGDRVAGQTLARCRELGLRCLEMPPLRDIDTPGDVLQWREDSGFQL